MVPQTRKALAASDNSPDLFKLPLAAGSVVAVVADICDASTHGASDLASRPDVRGLAPLGQAVNCQFNVLFELFPASSGAPEVGILRDFTLGVTLKSRDLIAEADVRGVADSRAIHTFYMVWERDGGWWDGRGKGIEANSGHSEEVDD